MKEHCCAQCGRIFTTPPIFLLDHENVAVCSKECADGYERFMETVEYYDNPTGQLELPFVAP